MDRLALPGAGSELAATLSRYRRAFVAVALFSTLYNILLLGGSVYMMLVYDFVVPSGSGATLVGLIAMVIIVYAFQGALDVLRSRVLGQIGDSFASGLAARIHDCVLRARNAPTAKGDPLQPIRDTDSIRAFLAGSGPSAIIDLPWIMFFLLILFLFHPYLGLTALVGALVMIALTLVNERMTSRHAVAAATASSLRLAAAADDVRAAETIVALGMAPRLTERWRQLSARHLAFNLRFAELAATLGTVSRTFRALLQSLVLAVGATLVIGGHATGGVIFASSVLTSRALAPVEIAIANWRGFVQARESWKRLSDLLTLMPPEPVRTPLPAPHRQLACEHLSVVPPGAGHAVVNDVSFALKAGQAVGVIGSSASGKTTLARALVGAWTPSRGQVRLDGAALDQWDNDALGVHLGYMPQEVALLAGTIAQNIARFTAAPPPEAVIAAARAAGVHEMIVRMPQGYDTPIGREGTMLSAGQRQRVALARALYGNPFLLVLDEPNANLDAPGEQALVEAIRGATARGAIAVVIAHRASVMSAVDMVLVMDGGRVAAFGPRDAVLARLQGQPVAAVGRGTPPAAATSTEKSI